MATVRRHMPATRGRSSLIRAVLPTASVAVASLLPLVPAIATAPLLPPLGLMTLVAWRLLRADAFPLWVALPLGAWDDLLGGAPLGTAMCGWMAILLALEVVDGRVQWRDQRGDWLIAVIAVAAMLVFALLIVRNAGSSPPLALLLPQIALAALLFPGVSRTCALLDRWRLKR